MKTVSITLDEKTFEDLNRIAKRQNARLEDMAAAYLADSVANDADPDYEFTEEDLAAIREGLDQLEAGQGIPHEQVVQELEQYLKQ